MLEVEEVLSVEDINSIYKHCVVLYKNKPVFVEAVGRNRDVSILDLLSQRSRVVGFNLADFANPTRRIGMVNMHNSVMYGYRTPVRRYKGGLTTENTKFQFLGVEYPGGRRETQQDVIGMRNPAFADALFNRYPTIQEATKNSAAMRGACAFDKQFAIDAGRNIWYKTNAVGTLPLKGTDVEHITFNAGSEHLLILLSGNHEKTVRNSWS